MASLVKRGNSAVWRVSFIDENGKRQSKSTGYRHTSEKETLLARALEAELSRREFARRAVPGAEDNWSRWVEAFLQRHAHGRTLERYLTAWRELFTFLREQQINCPRDLTYQHGLGFLKWRTAQKRAAGKKHIQLNTALDDLKVLRVVMRQAVRLGYAIGNPLDRLGVARQETKEKPELSDEDIAKIRKALDAEEPWMRTCFEIALNTGCRQRETEIEFRFIDFERKTITFDKPKGGRARAFTIPLPDAIEDRLRKIQSEGAQRTVTLPRLPGKAWWQFFQRMKEADQSLHRGICFHCTRVTFVTRLHRSGVPTSAAMKLVNHADELVHKIYQRLGVEDVRQYANTVRFPDAPGRGGEPEPACATPACDAKRGPRAA